MPLARILTLHPEDATTLIRQLEQYGFQVETASPHQEQTTPADLEIEFAVCDQQQVIGRAAAIAAQLQAEVVVFPRAIPPVPRAVTPVEEHAESITALENVATPEPEETATLEVDQPEAAVHDEVHVSESVWLPSLREKLRQSRQQAATGLRALQTRASLAFDSAAKSLNQYRERRRIKAEEAAILRHEQQREKERLRAEAAQQAALLEEEQRKHAETAAAARQEELQRAQVEKEQRLAEMERLRAEAREQTAALEQARLLAEAQQRQAQQVIPSRPERKPVRPPVARPSQARGVFTGAIAASFLFFVGMVLANFHPKEPFPADMNNGSAEQQVPFGATTVHGAPGVTIGGTTAARPVRATTTPSQAQAPAQAKPQPVRTSASSRKQKSQWRRFRRSSARNESDDTADDVVVRHYPQTQKPQPQHLQQAGLKHYSDMQ
jgi:hypothetical protein